MKMFITTCFFLFPFTCALLSTLLASSSSNANADTIPCDTQKPVVKPDTICDHGLTIPSLWWTAEQVNEGRLVETWNAYPGNGTTRGRIDLVVNQQIWSLLNYIERYDFINKFGTVAENYFRTPISTQGYDVLVFNEQQLQRAQQKQNSDQYVQQCTGELSPTQKINGQYCLAAYTCKFIGPTTFNCQVYLNSSGRAGMRGSTP